MKLADLVRAAELLPSGASLMLPRDALLEALESVQSTATPVFVTGASSASAADRWLSAKHVAQALGVSSRYVYAHRQSFPFAKQLPGGAVRFSERGLRRWMERTQ